MSRKSKKMREELLLEQDLTLTKLVDICQNMESVKLRAKEIKKVLHQIENLRKNLENETQLNLNLLRNPVINVDKNIKRDIRTIAKPQVRLATAAGR